MKTFKTLLLLLLSVTAMEARTIQKIANPTYVGINNGKMEIVSVRTTEEATTITFQYLGEGFGHFSPKTHIVDEQGRNYAMIGQKGFSEDSLKRLSPKKKGKYELRFEPLPEETRIFDLIEDRYNPRGSLFYGIRSKGSPFAVASPLPHNEGEKTLPDIDFKVDSVLITGQIINYDPEKCPYKNFYEWPIPYTELELSMLKKNSKKISVPIAKIDENGKFRIKKEICGPTWHNLSPQMSTSLFVPVMLYPNDHIDLQITLDEENGIRDIQYNSELKKDFSRLMRHAPIILTHSGPQPIYPKNRDYSPDYEQMTTESVTERFDKYDELGLYLSGKYGLDGVETEMLRAHLSFVAAIDVIGLTNRYWRDKLPDFVHHYNHKDTSAVQGEAWQKYKDSPYYGICFSRLRAQNNAFLATPFWTYLLSPWSFNEIPLIKKIDEDFGFYYLDTVYGDRRLVQGGIHMTPELTKKLKEFESQFIVHYTNFILPVIRGWRQQEGDDSLFEQACLLLPPRYNFNLGGLTNIFRQYTLRRQFFTHPALIRIASVINHYLEMDGCEKEEEQIRRTK